MKIIINLKVNSIKKEIIRDKRASFSFFRVRAFCRLFPVETSS